MLDDTSSLKAEHISATLRCNGGENLALWGKLNLSESRQILQNELEPSVFFPAYTRSLLLPSPFPLHLSPLSFFLPVPLPSLSHIQLVSCHQYGWQNISLTLLSRQKELLKQVNAQGSFAQGVSCLCTHSLFPMSPLSGISCAKCCIWSR